MAEEDRSPWGPAAIAAVFIVIAVSALVRFADMTGVWIVVLLAGLVASWYVREAVRRYREADQTSD